MNTTTKNSNISDIYSVLLETIEEVKTGKMPIEKAKAIAEVSQVAINAGKLECDYLKLAQKTNSKFLSDKEADLDQSLREIELRSKEPYKVTPKELKS